MREMQDGLKPTKEAWMIRESWGGLGLRREAWMLGHIEGDQGLGGLLPHDGIAFA